MAVFRLQDIEPEYLELVDRDPVAIASRFVMCCFAEGEDDEAD